MDEVASTIAKWEEGERESLQERPAQGHSFRGDTHSTSLSGSTSLTAVEPFGGHSEEKVPRRDELEVTFDGLNDPYDPRNISKGMKWLITFILSMGCVCWLVFTLYRKKRSGLN